MYVFKWVLGGAHIVCDYYDTKGTLAYNSPSREYSKELTINSSYEFGS